MPAPIEAVFFDVDDTLVDYDRTARAAFHTVFGAEADFDLWVRNSDPYFARYGRGEIDFLTMREQRTAAFLAVSGRPVSDAEAVRLEEQRFTLIARSYTLFDDVADCLDQLRERGLKLGLITNNEGVHQRDKLARVGLAVGFDVVVISGEVGVAKPDAEIFELACRTIGVPPERAMHIGDRLDFDALGAHAVGMHGVWLDRLGRHDGQELPVRVVSGLGEVLALVP